MKLRTLIRAYLRRDAEFKAAWRDLHDRTRTALAAVGGYATTSVLGGGYARTFELDKSDEKKGFFQGLTRDPSFDETPRDRSPIIHTDVGDTANAEERRLKGRPLKRVATLRDAIARRVHIHDTEIEIVLRAFEIFEAEAT